MQAPSVAVAVAARTKDITTMAHKPGEDVKEHGQNKVLHLVQVLGACAAWLTCSSGIILVNRYIMKELAFSYPMALSALGQVRVCAGGGGGHVCVCVRVCECACVCACAHACVPERGRGGRMCIRMCSYMHFHTRTRSYTQLHTCKHMGTHTCRLSAVSSHS